MGKDIVTFLISVGANYGQAPSLSQATVANETAQTDPVNYLNSTQQPQESLASGPHVDSLPANSSAQHDTVCRNDKTSCIVTDTARIVSRKFDPELTYQAGQSNDYEQYQDTSPVLVFKGELRRQKATMKLRIYNYNCLAGYYLFDNSPNDSVELSGKINMFGKLRLLSGNGKFSGSFDSSTGYDGKWEGDNDENGKFYLVRQR